MRAAVLLAVLALPLASLPASAANQNERSGGTVVVRYPDGRCGMSIAAPTALDQIRERGGEVISEVFRNGADATKKLRALKASGVCNS